MADNAKPACINGIFVRKTEFPNRKFCASYKDAMNTCRFIIIGQNRIYASFFGAIQATSKNRLPAAGLPSSAEKSAIGKFSVSARDPFENLISLINPKNDPQGPHREPPRPTQRAPRHHQAPSRAPLEKPLEPPRPPTNPPKTPSSRFKSPTAPKKAPRASQIQHKRLQSLKIQ